MDDQAEPAIGAAAEDECFVDGHAIAVGVGQVDVAHGDGDGAVNLNAVFGGVVVVADFSPTLQGEAGIFGEGRVAADEVGESAALVGRKVFGP